MADLGAWVPGFGSSFWFETPVHVYDAVAQPVHTGMRVGSLLCDSAEGWGPMSPTRDFDLTPCFQALVLWLLPAVAFCAVAAASLPRWLQCERSPRSDNSLHLLHEKDGVAGAIAVLGFVEFVVLIGLRSHVDGSASALTGGVQVLAAGAMSVAYIAALVLQHTMHWRARHGSDAAILLWSLHMITGPIRLRTILQLAEPGSVMQLLTVIPLCMRLLFVLIALLLECCHVEIDDGIALPDDDDALLAEEDVADTNEEDIDAAPQESPVETANLFSRLVFHWMQPLMSLGAKRYLTEADMFALPHGEDTERLSDAFQTRWIASAQAAIEQGRTLYDTGRMRFWKTLLGAFGRPFMIAAIFKVMQDVLAFVQPQLLRSLLAFVGRWETEEEVAKRGTPLRGFVLVALLFLTAMLQTMSLHQYFQLVSIAGMRARAGIVSAIFRKSLRLSNQERGDRRTGDVVNLMSVDANRLPDFIMYAHILWSAVFQITIAFVSLYNLLGWSAFVGVAIMVVSVPLNTALAHYLRQLSAQQMKVRDKRTGLMNEIVLNIKSIKLFAWEEAFTRRLLKVRNEEELPLLRNIGVASAGFNFFWQAIPFFVSLGTFITFSATSSQPLTADIVFPALSLYQLLNFPLSMLAGIVSMFLQTQVSAERLASFFDAEELDARARRVKAGVPPPHGEVIRFRGASLAWSLEEPITPTLRDVDLTIRRGELVALLGRVGDGKTSLLSAMLGDMVRLRGRVTVQGDIAYFSQGGWCMGATVRDNILFGRAYEEAHYQRCLEACALGPDLAILEHGDLTEIGERGVSLSGGQRARVALARACYASADIYLLDDPLAAVDAHVGAHLWEHVLGPRGMLRDKTRVLTLNAVSYLPQCDKIVTLRQGALLPEQGTFDEVMAMKGDVYRVITSLRSDDDETQAQEQQEAQAAHAPSPPADVSRPRTLDKAELKRATLRHLRESQAPKELQETGSVQWRVYQRYIHSASSVGVLLFFVAHIVTQAFTVARDVVLKQWSAANAQPGATEDAHVARHYLTLYALMGLLTSVGVCVAPMILYVWLVLSSARRFHDGLFFSVLRYPLQWFETTPTGRLLNLFSRDISVIDEVLPRVIQGMTRSSVVVLGVVCVVTYSVPAFLLAVVPLAMAYRAVMRYYLASSRELKRIDAVTKSPIFTWFQEALGGLTTIRAFGQAHAFTDAFEARVDRNQMCYFPAVTCNRWLAVRIECLGSVVILLASTLAVIMVVTGGRMSAGLLGLMLSQALSTTQTLNWAVRSASEVEQNIVSVERVLSYAGLPQERAYSIEATAPAAEWPARGEVEFRDYSTRYREGLDLVLRHVSFSTRPGERIGVCGRTGAGKSSLTLALFRILEADSGSIWIDGVDISTLGLHELRQAMAIIPQDPQLWHGTLRQNLDPLVHYSDTELYRALEQARLAHLVDDHEEGLERPVAEGGANFSAGQRQLICIARALVRQSRILVLDEATSSIDLETDALIQQIVRQEFSGTSITIAHRLATIMDSDRVLVLSQGEVAEFDTPANLLDQPSSLFYSLAKESGLVDRRRSYVSAS